MRSEDDGAGVGQTGGAGFKDGVLQKTTPIHRTRNDL
jgi:hypothetical protein